MAVTHPALRRFFLRLSRCGKAGLFPAFALRLGVIGREKDSPGVRRGMFSLGHFLLCLSIVFRASGDANQHVGSVGRERQARGKTR